MSWACLLKRVFDIDIEHCANCGGSLKIIAAIDDPPVIAKILTHLDLPARAPPRHRRGESICSRRSEDPKTACQRKPTEPLALSASERRPKEYFGRLPTAHRPSRPVQPWVSYQAEKELTSLPVLRYDSGHRKRSFKKTIHYMVVRISNHGGVRQPLKALLLMSLSRVHSLG